MSHRSRILVASHAWYGDLIGGAFRLASEFAEYLASREYEVTFVCCQTSASQPLGLSHHSSGVNLFRYPPPRTKSLAVGRMWHHVKRTQDAVIEMQNKGCFEYASLHSPLQALGALSATQSSDTRSVLTVHSPFDDEIGGNIRPGLNRWASMKIARVIDGRCCRGAETVQCASQYTLKTLSQKYPRSLADKGLVSPGWVDTAQFTPAKSRLDLRNDLGGCWQTDVPLFFCLRRLENRMGLDTLIEASRILKDRSLAFRLLIGGGGSLRGTLEDKIREYHLDDDVRLLGRLPEDQLSHAYGAADAFVLPTRSLECFGLILLEAFACDTPVIASNVAAIPEIAEKQGTGWMFEPGNAEQLADRMQAFVERRLQPTVNLREIALKYDKAKVLEEWERVLLGEATCERLGTRKGRGEGSRRFSSGS